jgi:hypothetical protein
MIKVLPAESNSDVEQHLKKKLDCLKKQMQLGHEINLKWLPSVERHQRGKKLAEEVVNNTVFIYTKDIQEAEEMVKHGYAEWILNQHTKPYRQLINKLIELFEEQQYERKEKTVDALIRLFKAFEV